MSVHLLLTCFIAVCSLLDVYPLDADVLLAKGIDCFPYAQPYFQYWTGHLAEMSSPFAVSVQRALTGQQRTWQMRGLFSSSARLQVLLCVSAENLDAVVPWVGAVWARACPPSSVFVFDSAGRYDFGRFLIVYDV